MSGPFGSSQWMYQSARDFYEFPIEQSLRFNDDDSAYLSRTPASAGNRKTATLSYWVKRGNLSGGTQQNHFQFGVFPSSRGVLGFNDNDTFMVGINYSGITWYTAYTNAVFRDTSSWYHVVVKFDLTNGTTADRVILYINGERQTFTSSISWQNSDTALNNTVLHSFGSNTTGAANSDGYFAEVNFIDGQALDPTSFGEFKSGVWIPKQYGGTYGTNGFRLSFADSSNIGDDTSGNTNDWTANSLVATDVLLDSPTNNFAVLNPLTGQTNVVLSEGNLAGRATANYRCSIGNFGMSSGKWYFEGMVGSSAAISLNATGLGIATDGVNLNSYLGDNTTDWGYIANTGAIYNGVNTGSRSVPTNGSIIGVAYDADNGDLYFSLNGVWQDSGAAIGTGLSGTWYPAVGYQSDSNIQMILNTGQDSSFAGNKSAQGNTDDNGIGDFYYAPPSGYLALCTANLPDPVIDPAQDDVPSDYFETKLYTGNGSTQSITGLTFQPDWVWIKNRSNALSHAITDAVRGNTLQLSSNSTGADQTTTDGITSFNSDGFSLGAGTQQYSTNTSGHTYVAWNWLAGNGTSSNTDGSISSTISVNQKAGFSIIGYTGNATAGATIGHSLGVAPSMLIFKNRDVGRNWLVYLPNILGVGNSDYLMLDQTGAEGFAGAVNGLNSTLPSSSVITLGNDSNTNENTKNFICYAFAEIPSYSSFGKYTGNGSADGPFVFTSFRPSWIMIKRTDSSGSWTMLDATRDTYNEMDTILVADASNSETDFGTANRNMDFLSNGFKIRYTAAGGTTEMNASGGTYIYMAFAEMPAKYSLGR